MTPRPPKDASRGVVSSASSCALLLPMAVLLIGCSCDDESTDHTEVTQPDAAPGDSGTIADGGAPEAGPTGPVTVQGRILVGPMYFPDGDTADLESVQTPNDTVAGAKDIGNPAVVPGHLAASADDASDAFRVSLSAGQSVTLAIAQDEFTGVLPDFDLLLWNDAKVLVDDSVGTGNLEIVTAATAGSYWVEVVPYTLGDRGLYTLVVGNNAAFALSPEARALRLSTFWPMVEGEALAGLRGDDDARRREHGRRVAARVGGRVLGHGGRAGYAHLGVPVRGATARERRLAIIEAIKTLRAEGEVTFAEPNYLRQPFADPPNDPIFTALWGFPSIGLPDAWDYSTGTGIRVAVLDTGVVSGHPDFVNTDGTSQLLAGFDMIADPERARDGDGRDADPEDEGDLDLPNGSSWHGSHVAGTIAAATNNAVGIAAVAPGAQVMPIRVLGLGGGTDVDTAQAILYAAGLPNETGQIPAAPAHVINMSFGGPGRSSAIGQAVTQARGAGLIVVAASGNEDMDATDYSPGGETGVVTVGAITVTKTRAFYSNFGSMLEVVAPGGDESRDDNFDGIADGIVSLVSPLAGSSGYANYQGTSMAAPHVSGIVALMKAAHPGLTPTEFDEMLAGQRPGVPPITEDLGPAGWDTNYGHGLLDATLAVIAARAAAENPVADVPVLRLSQQELDFGASETTLPVTLSNVGGGTLGITSITADAAWVTITPGALGENDVNVDRSALPDGVHTATLTIVTTGGDATLRVRAVVGDVAAGGDVGPVYVLLVDPRTREGVYQATAQAVDDYAFTFPSVKPGPYLLVAGTDLNGNGYLEEVGEVFGAYPVSSGITPIEADGSGEEHEFAVGVQR